MKAKLFLLSLLLMACCSLRAAPSFVYWQDFGDIPIDIDGVGHKTTKPMTICKPPSSTDSRDLFLDLRVFSGSNAILEVNPTEFNPAGNDCQSFDITLTPTGTGIATGSILVGNCVLGAAPCTRTLSLEANVIDSNAYQQRIDTGTYYTGRMIAIDVGDNRLANAQPLFYDSTNKFLLTGSSIALEFDVDSNRNILPRQEVRFPGAAGSLFCDGGSDGIYEFPTSTRSIRLRALSGHVLAQTQNHLLSDAPNCSQPTGVSDTLRIVDGVCGDREGVVGRLEIRQSTSDPWGTVCDDSWGARDSQVVCRQLGFDPDMADQLFRGCSDGSGPINLDNVQCRGTESSLTDCRSNPFGNHNCAHVEDVHVSCQGVGSGSGNTPSIIGCPNRAPSDPLLFMGCYQDSNSFTFGLLSSQEIADLNDGLGGEDTLSADFTTFTLPGAEPVGYFMLDNNRLLLTRDGNPATVIRKQGSSIIEVPNQEISQLSKKSIVALTANRLYGIDRNTNRPQLHWYPFSNSGITVSEHSSVEATNIVNAQIIQGSSNGIIAIGQPEIGGNVVVDFFMEVDRVSRTVPGIAPVVEPTIMPPVTTPRSTMAPVTVPPTIPTEPATMPPAPETVPPAPETMPPAPETMPPSTVTPSTRASTQPSTNDNLQMVGQTTQSGASSLHSNSIVMHLLRLLNIF